ncbi:MAG: heparinase II/III family protein [Armatimonadetes bacterium]|nr:heparinase II/III family protein [Armatimonadota bacterium]MDW8121631.1 heparinase II/III family protein [Armatimonadota bacterium]
MQRLRWWVINIVISLILVNGAISEMSEQTTVSKKQSAFFSDKWKNILRRNVERYSWAKETAERIVQEAQFWVKMSNEEIWSLMFGPTITRSWHVWSNGYCPDCKKPVPMYNWIMEPKKTPWKVRCPNCGALFPKNDFVLFYRSGLNEKGIFDPRRADRSLLFNAEHPNPDDPLHRYGVDDGEGYQEGENRWRFIGAYLIYGQWKQLVLGGLQNLAAAYLVTGDRTYARKAGILLDRVADLYPQFDFKSQALVYERHLGSNGYVSIWHDACEETRLLALVFDAIFDEIKNDPELIAFLSKKAKETGNENPKQSFQDIQRNIEENLLKDPLKNVHKISSNFPRTPLTQAVLLTVLSWEANRQQVLQILNDTLRQATAVDGVTGEKGLAGYSAFAVRAVAELLGIFERVASDLLQDQWRTFHLDRTFRFHIDTWFQRAYYPHIGDAGAFGRKHSSYAGANFYKLPSGSHALFNPSSFRIFWKFYLLTKDPTWVKVMWHGNGGTADGIPHDVFAEDPEKVQQQVKQIMEQTGEDFEQKSVNFEKWCLALLRSGNGAAERMVWLDYDSGGAHGHWDGMNLGLFAYGLDLMPDFGYPPVQFGGWDSPRAQWYFSPVAHNTVVVDGQNQASGSGKTTLWQIGDFVQVVRVSAPNVARVPQYERNVALIDLSEDDFYVVDIFRVVGGSVHDRFLHSYFGQLIAPSDKVLERPNEIPYAERREVQMRNFQRWLFSPSSPGGGALQWTFVLEDRFGYRKGKKPVRLSCYDLTEEAEFWTAEGWVALGIDTVEDDWIPRLMVRRKGTAPLSSTFIAVLCPYEGIQPPIISVRRLSLYTIQNERYADGNVALEVVRRDGGRDLIISMDVENPTGRVPDFRTEKVSVQKDWGVITDSSFCVVRADSKGTVIGHLMGDGSRLKKKGKDLQK